jgi:tRNA-Thr(GGU) m(6)t(6)A37 methyltransferase TsaA
MPAETVLTLTPIGYLRCNMGTKFSAPHQPKQNIETEHCIELGSQQNFEQAVQDLEGFDRLWLVSWFHRNQTWRPLVLPPRGPAQKRGVFATRSPHRPNPLGLTCVPLLRIEGRCIFVGETDLVDGTPILDIKPYIPSVDSFPHAKAGWVDTLEFDLKKSPSFSVEISRLAHEQVSWLKTEWSISFLERATELLSRDPTPHRTRRIVALPSGFRMGCGAWRIYFKVQADQVVIERISPGYPLESLLRANDERIHDREAQLAFLNIWRA